MTKPGRASDEAIVETILALVGDRGSGKTICPSEVARHLGGPAPEAWSPLMQPVRRAAVALAKEGRIAILRKGKPVADPDDFRGVYRLRLPSGDAGPGNQSST